MGMMDIFFEVRAVRPWLIDDVTVAKAAGGTDENDIFFNPCNEAAISATIAGTHYNTGEGARSQ